MIWSVTLNNLHLKKLILKVNDLIMAVWLVGLSLHQFQTTTYLQVDYQHGLKNANKSRLNL